MTRNRRQRRFHRITKALHQTASNGGCASDADLLPQHRTDRQFKAVKSTRHTQTRCCLNLRSQQSILLQVALNKCGIRFQIELLPYTCQHRHQYRRQLRRELQQ